MKLILLVFFFPLFALADFQILYNTDGEQRLESFGPGGSTSGEEIWNTDKDGPLPSDAPVGFAERFILNGKPALRENASMKAAKETREAQKTAKESADEQEKIDFAALKAKINAETATAAEIRKAFKFLLKRIGE